MISDIIRDAGELPVRDTDRLPVEGRNELPAEDIVEPPTENTDETRIGGSNAKDDVTASPSLRHHPVALDQGEYAEKIRAYRLSIGINQPELARAVGVSKNAVSNWEAGRSRPDLMTVKKLCEAFSISADDFLGIPDRQKTKVLVKPIQVSRYTAKQQQTLDRLLALPEKEREYLLTLLDTMEKLNPKVQEGVEEYENVEAFENDWVKGFSYYYTACAGEGNDVPEDDLGEPVYLRRSETPEDFDCVIPIDGDSMEPVYHSGDRVLVSKTETPQYGDIVIVFVNNVCMIKEYTRNGLRPLNEEKYRIVRMRDSSSVKLIGKVIGVLDKCRMLPNKTEQRRIDLFLEEHPEMIHA